jgi:phage FluMu protein Com
MIDGVRVDPGAGLFGDETRVRRTNMTATPPQARPSTDGMPHVDLRSREGIRCSCGALLFRAAGGALRGAVEIKCRRCGTLNSLRPIEPAPERRERLDCSHVK